MVHHKTQRYAYSQIVILIIKAGSGLYLKMPISGFVTSDDFTLEI